MTWRKADTVGFHIRKLQGDVAPVAVDSAQCITADLYVVICAVKFSSEPYVNLDNDVLILRIYHRDFYARCLFLWVCQDGLHGCR